MNRRLFATALRQLRFQLVEHLRNAVTHFCRPLVPAAVTKDLVPYAEGAQEYLVGLYFHRRVPVIALSSCDEDWWEPVRSDRLHIGRYITPNGDDAPSTVGAQSRGAVCHCDALRKPDEHDRYRIDAGKKRADDAIDVADVIRDRLLAILARHPARDDSLMIARVETMQSLHRYERPSFTAGNEFEFRKHVRGILRVTVESDQQQRRRRRNGGISDQGEAVSRCLDRDRSHASGELGEAAPVRTMVTSCVKAIILLERLSIR